MMNKEDILNAFIEKEPDARGESQVEESSVSPYTNCPDCNSAKVVEKDAGHHHVPTYVECEECGFYVDQPELWNRIRSKDEG